MNNSTQNGYVTTVLVVIIVILICVIGYITLSKKSQEVVLETLLAEKARSLVIQTWGDCTPDVCSKVVVSTEQKSSQWYITATYEGLRDDSSSAQRKVALATFVNNDWTLGTPVVTQSCQKDRGHQDFTAEPCI